MRTPYSQIVQKAIEELRQAEQPALVRELDEIRLGAARQHLTLARDGGVRQGRRR